MEFEIFLPMYYLMLLTVTVLLFSITVRLKEIYVNKTVEGEAHRHPLLMKAVDCLKTRREIWQIYLNSRFCSTLFASLFLLRKK